MCLRHNLLFRPSKEGPRQQPTETLATLLRRALSGAQVTENG
jgi:hypothetical protein